MTRDKSSTVSGFLRRLKFGSFGRCPYIVIRIEPAHGTFRSSPPKYRYLVKWKNKIATAFSDDNP